MNLTNTSQCSNVTDSLPPLNQPLAIIGGIIGLVASVGGQRLAPAVNYVLGHLLLTVILYLLLPRIIRVGTPPICCTRNGVQWVHAGLAVLFGAFGGLACAIKRRVGDFVTSGCLGALIGVLVLTCSYQWDALFDSNAIVLLLIIMPALFSAVFSQFIHQDIRIVAATASCGSYSFILAIDAVAGLSRGFTWLMKDLHLRANQAMYSEPYKRPDNKETSFQTVDYILIVWWFVESLLAFAVQLWVTTKFFREWLKQRREPPP